MQVFTNLLALSGEDKKPTQAGHSEREAESEITFGQTMDESARADVAAHSDTPDGSIPEKAQASVDQVQVVIDESSVAAPPSIAFAPMGADEPAQTSALAPPPALDGGSDGKLAKLVSEAGIETGKAAEEPLQPAVSNVLAASGAVLQAPTELVDGSAQAALPSTESNEPALPGQTVEQRAKNLNDVSQLAQPIVQAQSGKTAEQRATEQTASLSRTQAASSIEPDVEAATQNIKTDAPVSTPAKPQAEPVPQVPGNQPLVMKGLADSERPAPEQPAFARTREPLSPEVSATPAAPTNFASASSTSAAATPAVSFAPIYADAEMAQQATTDLATFKPLEASSQTTPRSAPVQVSQDIVMRPEAILPKVAQALEATLARNAQGSFEIRLQPAELGTVRMVLSPSEAGMQAVVTADRADVLDLLRRHGDALLADLKHSSGGNVDLAFADSPRNQNDSGENVDQITILSDQGDATAPISPTKVQGGGLDIRL